MPQVGAATAIPQELPPLEGPKLGLFKDHKSPITWLERLDIDRDGEETEGYVFRAVIKRREYAIKVFKFFDPITTKSFWGPLLGRDTPLKTAAYLTDPFFCECRAYGRINATSPKKLRRDIATPCHGFLFLGKRDEAALSRHIDLELDKVDVTYQNSVEGACCVRAIVKDVASPNAGVSTNNLRRILDGIKALNRAKLYNMDIKLANFRGGQLVDFGSSWTEPHRLLNAVDDRAARGYRNADRVRFDEMMETEKIPNPKQVRAMPDSSYVKKLRPRPPRPLTRGS
ncbi:kinetochore Sim4 complex subunit FTA2-domain-containing protein [Stachybotrys elegans]|uniref:Kinetochore Sim4 complex subunit FTA2-domain-containing protein n=1 Tax=Stachybotrys elegans TaxID=80388 RepID=A0A8K0SF93_9HYPO|nr:kinetochore Sim4 complex subunit FTA2-domain-containing protein [Stachybotrys elegans]